MKTLLICADWFLPGYRAGGIIRSVANISHSLKSDFHIYIFTRNCDLGSKLAYENILIDQWQPTLDGLTVFYASDYFLKYKNIKKVIQELQPDILYLNSMFSIFFTIFPILIIRWENLRTKIILAPRGMLKGSALKFKRIKKLIFLNFFRYFRFPRIILFQATDNKEIGEIQQVFGNQTNVSHVPDYPGVQNSFIPPKKKAVGEIAMLFIGRIHPLKNLLFLLELLKSVDHIVTLTIVGIVEDKNYLKNCQDSINELSSNISVCFLGHQSHDSVENLILSNHLFVLPSTGENFGHVIFESLSLGRPVLISDQTPWRNLRLFNAGWDIPLDYPGDFLKSINIVALMTNDEMVNMCQSSWNFCSDWLSTLNLKNSYKTMFGLTSA